MFSARRKRLAVEQVGSWWHSIDLGDGVITPGFKSPQLLAAELQAIGLPGDLRGRSVLDVGTWDGFYAFESERRGAERVVAVDYVVWAAGTNPEGRPVTEVPLPGRRGFDLARETLGSGVEPVVADFEKTGLRELGSFDVVLYLGVLYHMENPLHALRELAAVTGGLAIVETQAICVPGLEHEAIWQFFPADELNHDPSNWWVPNLSGLGGALTAAGFDRVTTMVGPSPELLAHEGGGPHHYRAVVHACKDAVSPR